MQTLNVNQKSLIASVAVHIFLLCAIFFGWSNDEVPVLLFSVKMNDNISVSQNRISTTIIASSKASEEKEKTIEKTKNKNKEEATKEKSTGKDTANSKQQNAVSTEQTPAIFDADYLQNPAPKYPPLSRRLGEQGLVLLSVSINVYGKAEKIFINKSSGFDRLDKAAIETVKIWRFVPAKQGSQIISSEVQIPINFILEK